MGRNRKLLSRSLSSFSGPIEPRVITDSSSRRSSATRSACVCSATGRASDTAAGRRGVGEVRGPSSGAVGCAARCWSGGGGYAVSSCRSSARQAKESGGSGSGWGRTCARSTPISARRSTANLTGCATHDRQTRTRQMLPLRGSTSHLSLKRSALVAHHDGRSLSPGS
jgi:hypothetical protein